MGFEEKGFRGVEVLHVLQGMFVGCGFDVVPTTNGLMKRAH